MDIIQDIYSDLGVPGFQESIVDLLAIVRNEPRQSLLPNYNLINDAILIAPNSVNSIIKQSPNVEQRFAGEGAEANNFWIPQMSVGCNFDCPLMIPAIGYINPALALLWDFCRLAYYGTAGVVKSKLVLSASVGDNSLSLTNIADFINMVGTGTISDGTISENISIVSANKSTRTIALSGPLQHNYGTDAEVVAYLPRDTNIEREPAFSLFSLREGLFAPTLINKLTIRIAAGEEISISAETMSLNIYRDKQLEIKSVVSELLGKYARDMAIGQILNGSLVQILPVDTVSGTYGMGSLLGDNLVSGNQTIDLPLNLITGITITIENNLRNMYSLHSLKNDLVQKRRENIYPFALISEGRRISGNITYRHSIDAFAFAEKLSGPSGIGNKGLAVSFDTFKIIMPQILWSPSTGTGKVNEYQERTLDWVMGADYYNSMPILELNT